jgi:Na+/H+ antiporter NhaD/arsenite permease-like protein
VIAWIHVPYWWHATLLEALWLLAGGVASALTLTNLYDSWKDKAALRAIHLDPSVHERHYKMIELAAEGRMSSQAARFVIALLITGTGVFGCYQKNPLGGKTTWTGLTVTACLVAIAVITAARSYFDYRQRNALYDLAASRTSVHAARLRARNPIIEQEET